MKIADYQTWVRRFDAERGLDQVQASQMLAHLMEELGEVAREVLFLEGYYEDEHPESHRQALAEELNDTFVFLCQLANHFQIDLQTALKAGQAKAHKRFGAEGEEGQNTINFQG